MVSTKFFKTSSLPSSFMGLLVANPLKSSTSRISSTKILENGRTQQLRELRTNGQNHEKARESGNDLILFCSPLPNTTTPFPGFDVLKSHDNLHDFRHTLYGRSCQLRAITTSAPNWNQRNSHTRTQRTRITGYISNTRTERPQNLSSHSEPRELPHRPVS